jgi:hypothetical protein
VQWNLTPSSIGPLSLEFTTAGVSVSANNVWFAVSTPTLSETVALAVWDPLEIVYRKLAGPECPVVGLKVTVLVPAFQLTVPFSGVPTLVIDSGNPLGSLSLASSLAAGMLMGVLTAVVKPLSAVAIGAKVPAPPALANTTSTQ